MIKQMAQIINKNSHALFDHVNTSTFACGNLLSKSNRTLGLFMKRGAGVYSYHHFCGCQ